jgi:aryl carrier-like protein
MEYLARTVSEAGVTVIDFVPSVLHLFVEHVAQGHLNCRVRKLLSIGEALPEALAVQACEVVADEVHNLYGPTEATVHVTWEQCREVIGAPTTPIGRPIANTQIYVLDRFGVPVPIGVPGELFLGGVQIAIGYVSRPDLTGERFPSDHFRGSGRLYRTGDLVKWRRDGRLEYLGRLDRQVKVAGTRVEPAEIESVLRGHPDLSDAFVTSNTTAGTTQLIAYLIPEANCPPNIAHLQSYARERLPVAAVPASFITLPAFPRLSNGKIDVGALPKPILSHADASAEKQGGTASGDRHRAALLHTLAHAAGAPVREDQSFIQCGGDSFGAMRAVAELKRAHGVSVSPYSLLKATNLAEFLDLLDAETELWRPRFTVTESELSEDGPTSLQQERWSHLASHGTVDLYCEIEGPVNLEWLEEAACSLVRRHRVLSSVFRAGGPPRQIAIDIDAPIMCIDLRSRSEAESREAISAAVSRCRMPFDIFRDPPIALEALKLSERRTLLLGRLHHIVTDGWSNSLLLEELEAAYREIERSGTDDRPPPAQYADFARAQRAFVDSPKADEVKTWWRKRFVGAGSPTRLPRRAPGGVSGHPDHARFIVKTIAPAARRRLEEATRARNGTVFIALLGAFALLMRDATGETDVLFGTSLAGRHQPGTEQMLGVFVNPLPVRARLDAGCDLSIAFSGIRDGFADLLQHQDYALIPLLKDTPTFADLGLNDVFDAHIVFQNYPAPSCTGPRRYRVIDPQDGDLHEVWGCQLGKSKIMRPLDLVAFDRPDGSISLNFGYKPALLEPSMVRSWTDAFIARLYRFSQ